MAIYSNFSAGQLANVIINYVTQLTNNLYQIQLIQEKLSAFSAADLETAGISASDLAFIQSALADANGLAQIFFNGSDPRAPGAGYIYFNSIKQITTP
jgi:hypothetical protein